MPLCLTVATQWGLSLFSGIIPCVFSPPPPAIFLTKGYPFPPTSACHPLSFPPLIVLILIPLLLKICLPPRFRFSFFFMEPEYRPLLFNRQRSFCLFPPHGHFLPLPPIKVYWQPFHDLFDGGRPSPEQIHSFTILPPPFPFSLGSFLATLGR